MFESIGAKFSATRAWQSERMDEQLELQRQNRGAEHADVRSGKLRQSRAPRRRAENVHPALPALRTSRSCVKVFQ